MAEDLLVGRNAVLEALKTGRPLNKLFIQDGERQGNVKEIIALAKEQGLPLEFVAAERLATLAGKVQHQGIVAFAAPIKYQELEDVLALAKEKNELPFLLLLDELQDPQNVGAIIRTAAAVGVHGVLLPKRRTCQITPAVVKASTGAIEYVPIVRIGNVVQALERLKKEGLWVVGADMQGKVEYTKADFQYPLVLVVGSEGKGMTRLVKETCDVLLRIPMPGKVNSLNASVASALLLYEVLRKRN